MVVFYRKNLRLTYYGSCSFDDSCALCDQESKSITHLLIACLVGVGEADHPMVLKTVLRTGGRQLEEGFTNRKEELSTP
jgi:hypothetical protein